MEETKPLLARIQALKSDRGGALLGTDCCLMASPLGTPRERYDEHSSKSFPSVKKPRYVDLREERQMTEGDADWLNSTPIRVPFMTLVDSSSVSNNAEPAHNTTKYSVPNLR
jgi:hypothetical protein